MRISKVTSDAITFDNGMKITFGHLQDCCEQNYADFNQIEEMALNYDFDEDLQFESVKRAGFRFGNRNRNMMFFYPLLLGAKWILFFWYPNLLQWHGNVGFWSKWDYFINKYFKDYAKGCCNNVYYKRSYQ